MHLRFAPRARPKSQLRNQSRCPVETQLFARDDNALPGMGQIDAPLERNTFDILGLHRLLWNVRQTPVELATRYFFPRAPLDRSTASRLWRTATSADLSASLPASAKGSFPGQVEVRDIPSFIQPARHFQRCVERLHNRLAQLEHLFIRHMEIERGPARAAKSSTAPVTRSFASSNRAAATRFRSGM